LSRFQIRIPKEIESTITELELEGKTVVTAFVEEKLIGLIAVANVIREDAVSLVKKIKPMGKEVILLSGDNQRTTQVIANK
jgi:P-type E1-E2 ATPase